MGEIDCSRKRREGEVILSARRLRKKFLTYKDAEIIYSLSHKTLLALATEANALYRHERTVLIDRDLFDIYLEKYHEKSTLQ